MMSMIGNGEEYVLNHQQKMCIYISGHFQPYEWKMYHQESNDTQVVSLTTLR